LRIEPEMLLEAALLTLPPDVVFSGYTAAWLHGLEPQSLTKTEAILPATSTLSVRTGVSLSRASLRDRDIVVRGRYRFTTIERALRDIARRHSLTETVVATDAALHAGLTRLDKLSDWLSEAGTYPGGGRLRRALLHAEPASESPMESRLRMLLVLAGLPRPMAQVTVRDRHGRALGRPDLYYPEQRLGIEYDGATHRTSLVADSRRQNRLLAAGITLLRFTAADMNGDRDAIVRQVAGLLGLRVNSAAA